MVKFVMCIRRQPHLSREEFQDYWLNSHGPLVKSLAGALGMRRYVQLHTADSPINGVVQKTRGSPEPYDGIAEIWYDSMEAFENSFSSDEARAAGKKLRADEPNFIDLANSPGWISEEKVLIP